MIIDLFIAMLLIALILTILTVYDRSIMFAMIGLILWLLLMAQSLSLTDVAGNTYNEYGVSAFTLAFVFTHIILLIIYYMDLKFKTKFP